MEKSRIKNEEQHEALKDKGCSKEKAARIANTENAGEKGGIAKRYEERSRTQLYKLAKEIGIKGRTKMDKSQLIEALRNN